MASTRLATVSPASLLLLGLLLVWGCQVGSWRLSTPILADSSITVQLETWDQRGADGGPRFAHPAQLSPIRVAEVLAELAYTEARPLRKRGPQVVVAAEHQAKLAGALTSALAQAGPRDRIRFAVRNDNRGPMAHRSRTTGGVAFVDPAGTLNLQLEQIDDTPVPDDQLRYGPVPHRPIKLSLPSEVSEHPQSGGKVPPIWLVIDLRRAAEPGPAPLANPSPPAQPPRLAPSDQERVILLRFLEELFLEGAIDEPTYRRKRSELLNEGEPPPEAPSPTIEPLPPAGLGARAEPR